MDGKGAAPLPLSFALAFTLCSPRQHTRNPGSVLDFDVGAAVEPTVSLPFFTALDALEPPDAPNSIDVAACPVRLLHGLCDHVTPVAAAGRLVGQISGSDVALTVLKSAGARLHAPDELDALAAAVMALWEQDLRRARAGGGGGGNKKNSAGE